MKHKIALHQQHHQRKATLSPLQHITLTNPSPHPSSLRIHRITSHHTLINPYLFPSAPLMTHLIPIIVAHIAG